MHRVDAEPHGNSGGDGGAGGTGDGDVNAEIHTGRCTYVLCHLGLRCMVDGTNGIKAELRTAQVDSWRQH